MHRNGSRALYKIVIYYIVHAMSEHRSILIPDFLRHKEFVLKPEVVLDSLFQENYRPMGSVLHRLSKSEEYGVADREDLEWFMNHPDEAFARHGAIRSYERIVFFGSKKLGGFETLMWDRDARDGKGEYLPGREIPLTFVWNATLGLAALHEKVKKTN